MKIITKLIFIPLATGTLFLSGCGKKSAEATDTESPLPEQENSAATPARSTHATQIEEIAKLFPNAQTTSSGLSYIVEKEGEGEKPQKGQMVTAHYHGTLLNGEVFDSSVNRGKPFSFFVGKGQVIKGWDEAFLDMRKGEKRKLILPSRIAYGNRAAGPIPSNSILIFDVELLDFK